MSYLEKSALRVVGTRPIRPDGVDKVTGRANFGADMTMPGMLWGRIKRSPHAHARIVSIDVDKALALPGVKAVVTRADFPDVPPEKAHIGAAPHNLRDLSLNCMAKGKALYEELIPRLRRKEQEILSCLSAQERKDFALVLGKIEKSLGLVQTSKDADNTGAY